MKLKVAVIGLGYVGLPLALNLSKTFDVIGYDVSKKRVSELNGKFDSSGEMSKSIIRSFNKIKYSNHIIDINQCNVFIITLPTPIKKNKTPDLSYLINATNKIASIIKQKDLIIFESTVYPGVTEDLCKSIIEKKTGMKINKDFFVGYSPERINPGDKVNTINNIVKIISSPSKYGMQLMTRIYGSICKKLHKVNDIRVAEGSKVIENIQRDVNIALVNELSISFNKLGVNFRQVLEAANTKWNFHDFKPGLVGGHCIGVDPYYLAFKLKEHNYNTRLILSGRQVNDNFSKYISKRVIKDYKKRLGKNKKNPRILILGFSFKENVRDIRNTKVIDLFNELKKFTKNVQILDPIVDEIEVKKVYKIKILKKVDLKYDICIFAVPHKVFLKNNFKILRSALKFNGVIYDLKHLIPKNIESISI